MDNGNDSIFDNILNQDEYTKIKPGVINCKQFLIHSCPKEIIRILNEVLVQVIAGARLPSNFIDKATLSDFIAKSRYNAFKQSFFMAFAAIVATAIILFNFFMDSMILTSFSMLASFFVIMLSQAYILRHSYWYGIISGSAVDKNLKAINQSSGFVFYLWFAVFYFFKIILYIFFLASPAIYQGAASKIYEFLSSNSIIRKIYVNFAGNSDGYYLLLEKLQEFSSKDPTFFIKAGIVFIVSFSIITAISMYIGFKWGERHQIESVKSDHEEYMENQKYAFDQAIEMLNKE